MNKAESIDSDTVKVTWDGRSVVDMRALLQKPHVKALIERIRDKVVFVEKRSEFIPSRARKNSN